MSGCGMIAAAPPVAEATELPHDDLVKALMILAGAGIEPDIQELLVRGNPARGVPPGVLGKVLAAIRRDALTDCLGIASNHWADKRGDATRGGLPSDHGAATTAGLIRSAILFLIAGGSVRASQAPYLEKAA